MLAQTLLTLLSLVPAEARAPLDTLAAYAYPTRSIRHTVNVAADVACAETTHHWAEARAVLSVAVNRARRRDRSLARVLMEPFQFAHNCPRVRLRWQHRWLATEAALGALRPPTWMRPDTIAFCTPRAERRVGRRWRRRGLQQFRPEGALHVYWHPRGDRLSRLLNETIEPLRPTIARVRRL